MIRVRAEIWPQGDRRAAHVARDIIIYNDGTGSDLVGNYAYAVSKDGGFSEPIPTAHLPTENVYRFGQIIGFDRRLDVTALVQEVLQHIEQ